MKIMKIDFDELKKEMIIQFTNNAKIIIEEPDHILESSSVLKILTAKKVKLEFQHERKNSTVVGNYFKSYSVVKNKIKTNTNIDWTKQNIDAAFGQDALIIFN